MNGQGETAEMAETAETAEMAETTDDGGNDIQSLDSTVERYFLHGLAVHLRFSGRRFSGVDQKDLQLGQEKMQQNMGFSHYQPQSTSYVNL